MKLFFVEGRGRAFILEKKGQRFFMGILKTNTTVFRLEEGRRKGFKHPKSRGKNYSFDLYGKITKKTNSSVLRLVEGRRRASNTQKTRT